MTDVQFGNVKCWLNAAQKCGGLEVCLDVSDVTALVEEVERLKARLDKSTGGLACFSCGVAWTPANDAECCPYAHRETWPHEWVTKRERELTAKVCQGLNETDNLKAKLKIADERLASRSSIDGEP